MLEMAQRYYDEVKALKDENARLSGRAKRPELKPSTIAKQDRDYQQTKRKRTERKNPTKSTLPITQTITLKPQQSIPEGARFKGYKSFYVQEIKMSVHHICYRRERWKLPNGETLLGALPEEIKSNHFGPQLRQFILYQYFHNHVTQPLLLNQLRELGFSISSGQLSNLLTKKKCLLSQRERAAIA
ncbi:MAG: hypothetical protein Q9M92_11730 [Enterobacterales bacterium]|nr:hypothetical protein [Enterobacterales bacterium]